jgi:CheY-like chemotaxis protein
VTRRRSGRIPAISLTAHACSEDCARALEAGFNGHLAKPVDIPKLAATIRSLTQPAMAG